MRRNSGGFGARGRCGQGPIFSQCATEGTPVEFSRKSMYHPGGATRLDGGAVAVMPPARVAKRSSMWRWFMSLVCVTELGLIRTARATTLGVSTANAASLVMLDGAAVMV